MGTCDQDRGREGFILLESLVSLAMVSILAVGSFTLVQNLSRTFRTVNSSELTPLTNELARDPDAHSRRANLRLESVRNLPSGAVWRTYEYRTDDGQRTTFSVFEPPEK